MTDTVLQSFCERCGTRYTVTEQETRRESGLTKIGRSLGLRSAPKPPGEPNVANALPTHDPFKATFHFCLECRQYTCQDCWNPDAGFCQTCYPIGAVALHAHEGAASPEVNLAGSASATPMAVAGAASVSVPEQPPSSAWPTSDLDRAAASAAPSPVASRPTTDPADGSSPWGPGVADVTTPAWDVASEADRDVVEDSSEWRHDQGIAAAAMLRAADGPATDPRPDEAVLWGSQAPSASDDTDADTAPTQVIDPWRGVVFSYDQPQVAASEVVESPPQPDPNLPWLAKANAAPADPVAEALDGTAVADETRREIDHRGWIAGSTIATGAAWSQPVPQWPDEAAAASPVEIDADGWDPVPDEQPTLVEDSTVDAGADEDRTPPDMRDHWVGIAAFGAISGDADDHDETRASDDDLALDGPTVVDDSAEARPDVEAWPAVDTLATVDAIHAATPSPETAPEPEPEPDRVDHILAAAAAGAVIGAAADMDDGPPRELSQEPKPEAEAPEPQLAGPVGPAVPPWIPLEAPVGGSEAPVPTGPFATSSPLPPQPPPALIQTNPPPPLPPPPVAPTAPTFANTAPMAMPPPVAPPPPLGMAAPPAAPTGHATPHPAFVAPLLAAPGVGLQPSSGPVPSAAPKPMAAPMPTAQGPGTAGQTKAHPCQSCGLPLSAKARFCRRCGSQQAA